MGSALLVRIVRRQGGHPRAFEGPARRGEWGGGYPQALQCALPDLEIAIFAPPRGTSPFVRKVAPMSEDWRWQGLAALLAGALCAWALRVASVARRGRSTQPAGPPPVRTLVVLGSGGHTAEMLALLRRLDRARFAPLLYVLATTDHTSAQRLEAFERDHAPPGARAPTLFRLPRSREVGQSYLTSVATTLHATAHAVALVFRTMPSLVVCNGPGTCIPVCFAALMLRLLGIRYVAIVYVESIARVESLSLSGKILRHVADHFIVQWPQLARRYPGARFLGRLC